MNTPSTPAKGASAIRGTAGTAAGNAKDTAHGTAKGAAKGTAGAAAGAGGQVVALPGRVAGLTKLLTLRRLLRAVPIAAAAGAGLAVGRLTARKR